MTALKDHATMTQKELHAAFLAFIESCGHTWDESELNGIVQTPQNINWMFAVYAIERGVVVSADDLVNLLASMDKHYAGPISIHEGWGGCEADSNKELITEKIEFDMREGFGDADLRAELVKLGWIAELVD